LPESAAAAVRLPLRKAARTNSLTVANGNPVYVWSGNGAEESATKNWAKHIAKLFAEAKIKKAGHMMSHLLRDTQ
jgi:hypothetical protein